MELHLPADLEARLNRLATDTGREAEQVAVELLQASVDHDEWFRQQVEVGRQSAREGQLLDHADVEAGLASRYRG